MYKQKKPQYQSYANLAWTESIITSPEEYAGETNFYIKIIKKQSKIKPKTLLHLGCGAGGNDYTFKKHFKVTGVDISREMLKIAEKTNPDVRYIYGDMRNVKLNKLFDAVAIPDSIDYMATLPELKIAIKTAVKHLRPGGVFLATAKIREKFQENNFCYTGSKGNTEIVIFENNHIPKNNPSKYEAIIVYLIRRKGKLSIYTDRHKLGLFSEKEWVFAMKNAGLRVTQAGLDGVYDRFMLGEGKYQMRVFSGGYSA